MCEDRNRSALMSFRQMAACQVEADSSSIVASATSSTSSTSSSNSGIHSPQAPTLPAIDEMRGYHMMELFCASHLVTANSAWHFEGELKDELRHHLKDAGEAVDGLYIIRHRTHPILIQMFLDNFDTISNQHCQFALAVVPRQFASHVEIDEYEYGQVQGGSSQWISRIVVIVVRWMEPTTAAAHLRHHADEETENSQILFAWSEKIHKRIVKWDPVSGFPCQ